MIQVYTGNGKGKTTASLGLALRAAGAGLKVYIGQFIKAGPWNEIKALKSFKNIKVEQFGRGCFISGKPAKRDIQLAEEGFERINKIILTKKYNLVILDEINVALNLKLIEKEKVVRLIKSVSVETELVLTGRNAHPEVIKIADLVSDIRDRKHYYRKKIRARKGIEY